MSVERQVERAVNRNGEETQTVDGVRTTDGGEVDQ